MSSVLRIATVAWSLPIAAGLLAGAYVLNAGLDLGVHPTTMTRPLIVAAVAAVVITALMVTVTRSRDRGGAAAVVLLAITVAGGAIGTVLTRTEWWQAAVWLALIVAAVALLARIVLRERRRRRLVPSTGALNTFGVAMLATVIAFGILNGRIADVLASSSATTPASTAGNSTDADIVVILLDGYPRTDVLDRVFDYDNSAFLDQLRDRGFTVAERATSNYAWTELTVLSMLHMRHATDIPAFVDRAADGRSQPWLRDLTGDNPVFGHARDAGYEVVSVSNNMDHTTLRGADVLRTPPGYSDFELHLLGATALAGSISLVDPAHFARNHRQQVLWGLDAIEAEAATNPGGRLIIGHVLSPHLPVVFERDGSLRPVRYDHNFYTDFRALVGTPRDAWNAAFRGQVEYLNTRVIEIVGHIVDANPDATLIVMSDHGSGSDYRADDPESDIDERYSILFAARNAAAEAYPDDVTPVNIFQPLLADRLDLDLPMQPNTRYVGYLELGELPTNAR